MRTHPTALGDSLWNHRPGKTYKWDSPACLVYLGKCRNPELRIQFYSILRPLDLNLIVQGRGGTSRTGVKNACVC